MKILRLLPHEDCCFLGKFCISGAVLPRKKLAKITIQSGILLIPPEKKNREKRIFLTKNLDSEISEGSKIVRKWSMFRKNFSGGQNMQNVSNLKEF